MSQWIPSQDLFHSLQLSLTYLLSPDTAFARFADFTSADRNLEG